MSGETANAIVSKLLYHGTAEEVREGDRIEWTTLFLRRRRTGTVVCIPEKTGLELAAENKDPDDWLIRFDDGTDFGWIYCPEEVQPPKRLRLVARGADYERVTAAELERQEAELEAELGWKGDLFGCLILIAIAFAIIMSIAVVKYGLPW